MTDKCAQSAQQSNSFCAYYAHDRSSAAVHNRHMFDPDWFKRRKKELRLSDTAIGAAIGRDRSVANRIINGSLDFDMKHMDGLAKAFQVGKEELLLRFGDLAQTPMHHHDHPPVGNDSANAGPRSETRRGE